MAAKEILRIHNFAGIKDAEIEIGRMNVFIGPQASGKSVAAKLLYFFRERVRRLVSEVAESSEPDGRPNYDALFHKYFPPASLGKGAFDIRYSFGDFSIVVQRRASSTGRIEFDCSEYYDSLLKYIGAPHVANDGDIVQAELAFAVKRAALLAKVANDIAPTLATPNYYIPAGRSFFSTIERAVFTLIENDATFDPFLVEFGRNYERFRREYEALSKERKQSQGREKFRKHVAYTLRGTFRRIAGRDYIVHEDGREVPVEISSSGQQASLPMVLFLMGVAETSHFAYIGTAFIEEPEAHLFPSAQREIVHLISDLSDLFALDGRNQYVITTHSPYILTAINNLMYGGQIVRDHPSKQAAVAKVLNGTALIDPANVRAYAFEDGYVKSIIDSETGLVVGQDIDSVSNEIGVEFEALLDIAYAKDAA